MTKFMMMLMVILMMGNTVEAIDDKCKTTVLTLKGEVVNLGDTLGKCLDKVKECNTGDIGSNLSKEMLNSYIRCTRCITEPSPDDVCGGCDVTKDVQALIDSLQGNLNLSIETTNALRNKLKTVTDELYRSNTINEISLITTSIVSVILQNLNVGWYVLPITLIFLYIFRYYLKK